MLRKLTNFSIAVNDIQGSIDLYRRMFNLELMRPLSEPSQYGFRTAWLGNGDEAFIELLEPTEPNSAVARFIKSKGEGVYLVSFEVEDLAQAVRQVRSEGGRIAGLPEGKDPQPQTRAVWVHPSTTRGVFIELRRSGGEG